MITRQAMYVKRNVEEHSCNHCCSGKAMSITQPECKTIFHQNNAPAHKNVLAMGKLMGSAL
jgi:hypothetical protein